MDSSRWHEARAAGSCPPAHRALGRGAREVHSSHSGPVHRMLPFVAA